MKLRAGDGAFLPGRSTVGERHDLPMLVALAGGGYDARYFDAPHASLHARARAAGFSLVAVTRPGYPASADSAARQPPFSAAADLLSEAIDDAWARFGGDRPGIILLGHSIGGAVAVHVAAGRPNWPLLGLSISGVGDSISAVAVDRYQQLPPDVAVSLPFDVVRPSLYGPDWTVAPEVLRRAGELRVSTPSADLREITGPWSSDLDDIAERIRVPLHYALTEFDALWEASPESVARFARRFVNAPFVEADLWRGAGHNIEHHLLGEAYALGVFAFAHRCAMERRRPE